MDRRIYRNKIAKGALKSFRVAVKETDLLIHAEKILNVEATESVLRHRAYIESFIHENPSFATSLVPWHASGLYPHIVSEMITAGKNADVGPMAAVAGAMSQFVGQDILAFSHEVIVENGGDIFLKTESPLTVGIFAGASPLNLKIGLKIDATAMPKAVCTSSGTIGHSLSHGIADAVVVLSDSCALADAAATAIGNQVTSGKQIRNAIEFGKQIPHVDGIVIIVGGEIGMWGAAEVVGL